MKKIDWKKSIINTFLVSIFSGTFLLSVFHFVLNTILFLYQIGICLAYGINMFFYIQQNTIMQFTSQLFLFMSMIIPMLIIKYWKRIGTTFVKTPIKLVVIIIYEITAVIFSYFSVPLRVNLYSIIGVFISVIIIQSLIYFIYRFLIKKILDNENIKINTTEIKEKGKDNNVVFVLLFIILILPCIAGLISYFGYSHQLNEKDYYFTQYKDKNHIVLNISDKIILLEYTDKKEYIEIETEHYTILDNPDAITLTRKSYKESGVIK